MGLIKRVEAMQKRQLVRIEAKQTGDSPSEVEARWSGVDHDTIRAEARSHMKENRQADKASLVQARARHAERNASIAASFAKQTGHHGPEHKLVSSARTEARDAWDRGAPVFIWRSPVRSDGGDAAVAGAKLAVAIAFLPAAAFMRADPITKGGKAKQKALEDEVVDGSLTAILEIGWKLQDVKPAALGAFYTFVRSPA